jgi:asparagine synthase (glutamine-hydrolysing)
MCGIVGYWALRGEVQSLEASLPTAVNELHHRGPDGKGVWHDGIGVGLGHTRLAILDLSDAGAQPMVCHATGSVIVFNGEIYNFREVATELGAVGHTFGSNSDTEVVLAAYREWGPSCVDRFVGMFAFAIWDRPRKCLRLFRDRIGVKPLYYGWDGNVLCFASELKALRALPHWSVGIDETAVGEFLQYGYIAAPRTIYRNVNKLPPGSWLHLEFGGEPRIAQYWSLRDVVARGPLSGDADSLESELEDLLKRAFRYRLVSDVPVGLFLSGGVDSSLVAGILRRCGVELETFTVGFPSEAHDESAAAANVAGALGLKNHRHVLDMGEATNILASWPKLYDEPFGDHSGIPTYLVARLARERVKVALSADGGDELFCGYAGYPLLARRMSVRERMPSWARAAGVGLLDLMNRLGPSDMAGGTAPRLHRVLGHGLMLDRQYKLRDYLSADNSLIAIRPFRTFWQAQEIVRLLGISYRDPRQTVVTWFDHPIERIAAMDLHEFLPDDVLTKVDRATMAVGLEAREPLLDHRIVEFAFRLPIEHRFGSLGNKHILRKILYRHVPRELVDRPKQGFAVPIREWMEHLLSVGRVQDSIDVLREKMPCLDPRQLEGSTIGYSGSDQGKNRLWLIYVLGQWAERWL